MPTISPAKIRRVAREKLEFDRLRPGQQDAVRAVVDGHDTLVVQPTGSGKSAIYQIAGHLLNGPTVVVSPLIALQKDQVESINEQPHEAEAAQVNSAQPARENRAAFDKLREGDLEYLFLAPEQLAREETREKLRAHPPSLFVVDEAHCISEWGHDFRPDYLQLGEVIEALGHPVTLAMTATATEQVRQEIIARLHMREPRVFVHAFDRPNISLRVDHFTSESEKQSALVRRVGFAEKPGIVYTATRKTAELIAGALTEQGIEASIYHAGLKAKDRHGIQDRFMESDDLVIIATNAFGMGVDKNNVRFVFHHDIADSLDSYYQEIGRAGRDGEPAEAVLFYRHENTALRRFQAGTGKLDRDLCERVAAKVRAGEAEDAIATDLGVSVRKLSTIRKRLGESLDVDAALAEHAEYSISQRQRLDDIVRYAETRACRRQTLLSYFGDEFEGPCGNCDNCAAAPGGVTAAGSPATAPHRG